MKLPVAILAGGLATRLRPITETIPKALVDVAGTPFILRQLNYLRRQGISRVVLCVGFLGEQIEAVVGDGAACGLSVSYSQDWPTLMGTGGALRQALPLLDSQFLVLYGDSYLPIDFGSVERAFLNSGKPALMTVQRNADQWDKSNVLFVDNVIVEYNKQAPTPSMKHIDYGLGAISAQVLANENTTGAFDLADIYHRLSLSGQLAGYEVHERFYEIGSHKGLAEAADFFKSRGE
jgi:N-acetyl-alpha-D-muramate 1-phosphate uridylyltransferase